MECYGCLYSRLQNFLISVLSLPSASLEDQGESFLSDPQPTAPSESYLEESHAFIVKNLCTGEALDLREENSPDFAQRFASLLSHSDKQAVGKFL